jgi:1,4-dihydroxy-2-naphthoate octaprenyltransferase
MHVSEPTLARLPNPVLRYFLATRPAFLSVTLLGCLVGLASAFASGVDGSIGLAAVTLLFALVAHAGVNVLNDYYDALNGTDALNTGRIFPYTGGSRFIQNAVLTSRETARFGAALFGAVMAAGFVLMRVSSPGLFAIGAAGLFIGWAYSAPPLALNSRGVGELCVALGFGLVVVGTDLVQRADFSIFPVVASVSYALLVANVLYMNQFPDRAADAAAGKRHWVVRLPVSQARWGYVVLALIAYLWLVGAVVAGALPPTTLLALLATPLTVLAARDLMRYAQEPGKLQRAIERSIAGACTHGALLAVGLALPRMLA